MFFQPWERKVQDWCVSDCTPAFDNSHLIHKGDQENTLRLFIYCVYITTALRSCSRVREGHTQSYPGPTPNNNSFILLASKQTHRSSWEPSVLLKDTFTVAVEGKGTTSHSPLLPSMHIPPIGPCILTGHFQVRSSRSLSNHFQATHFPALPF